MPFYNPHHRYTINAPVDGSQISPRKCPGQNAAQLEPRLWLELRHAAVPWHAAGGCGASRVVLSVVPQIVSVQLVNISTISLGLMNGGYIELVIGIINQQTSLRGHHLVPFQYLPILRASIGNPPRQVVIRMVDPVDPILLVSRIFHLRCWCLASSYWGNPRFLERPKWDITGMMLST